MFTQAHSRRIKQISEKLKTPNKDEREKYYLIHHVKIHYDRFDHGNRCTDGKVKFDQHIPSIFQMHTSNTLRNHFFFTAAASP